MTSAQLTLLSKLATAWDLAPNARLGQLLESVENVGWDLCVQRAYAPRLASMGDDLLAAALDEWCANPARRVVVS